MTSVFVIFVFYCAIGLLLSHILDHSRFGRWDNSLNEALARGRSPWLNDLTNFGSKLVDRMGVIAIFVVAETVFVARRIWRFAIALPIALASELSIFIATNELSRRLRPPVSKLGAIPKTFSFPSGHTAAAVVLFGLIAIAIAERCTISISRSVYGAAGILVVLVGFSRVYRGMHHTTDVVAGAILGCLAVVIGLRAANLVQRSHD